MTSPILVTKLFIPAVRPNLVRRSHLIERLDKGLDRKCTLVCAPAGFGKTTLVTEWLDHLRGDLNSNNQIEKTEFIWLSLDEADNDPTRFLAYMSAALGQIEQIDTAEATSMLQSPQLPAVESILTPLINQAAALPNRVVFVLDDYHLIEAQPVHDALAFLIANLPPQMHLVIATREDPLLPLSRLRVRRQISELRAADLRFTNAEAAEFLNQIMGLDLSPADIATLERRTEGWIAGLQLAAITMRSLEDTASFIQSFSGSNRLVLDYLIEEVLNQQSEDIQQFLLQTSILNRISGPLCNAVTQQDRGQQVLEYLEKANLFVVPLDNQRQWYRYHQLFADLLRNRLPQTNITPQSELHIRASQWYEDNGLEVEAFHHAAVANDLERAERLIEGKGMPLSFRGVVTPVLDWLESLPKTVLDSRPSLWVTYAQAELTIGRMTAVEKKLLAAEAALDGCELNEENRDLIGRIANVRANVAVGHRQLETILAQSQRALEFLHPENLTHRTATTWKLGVAYELQGDRVTAKQAYTEAISICKTSGNLYTQILATTGLANILLAENQLHQAAETYRKVLDLVGDLPIPVAPHVHLCLAKISYEWNDLEAAQQHAEECFQVAQPYKRSYDIYVACQVFLARLKIAQGDLTGAEKTLTQADQSAKQHNFGSQIPEITAIKVLTKIKQGDITAAARLAQNHDIPLSQARVFLAQKEPTAALALLEPIRHQAIDKCLLDEQLKVKVLEAIIHYRQAEKRQAVHILADALDLAESGGFVRTFVDEGPLMARLLYEALSFEIARDYVQRLLAAFSKNELESAIPSKMQSTDSEWIEPLTERELDILQLMAEGLTNPQIGQRLYLALNTIKAHSRNIYGKLGVNNRTQAVLKAKSLGIISEP
jgi:LuxR family maltose regulon positive regulatory protein